MNIELSKSELSLIVHSLYQLSEISFVKESMELANKLNDIKNGNSTEMKAPYLGDLKNIKTLIESEDSVVNKNIVIEECSELIKAITKDIRQKKDARRMVIEEMCDVIIGLQMCVELYNIDQKEIDKEYNRKMVRNLERAVEKENVIKFKKIDPTKKDYCGRVIVDFENGEYLKSDIEYTLGNIIDSAVKGKSVIVTRNASSNNLSSIKNIMNDFMEKYRNSSVLVLKVERNG